VSNLFRKEALLHHQTRSFFGAVRTRRPRHLGAVTAGAGVLVLGLWAIMNTYEYEHRVSMHAQLIADCRQAAAASLADCTRTEHQDGRLLVAVDPDSPGLPQLRIGQNLTASGIGTSAVQAVVEEFLDRPLNVDAANENSKFIALSVAPTSHGGAISSEGALLTLDLPPSRKLLIHWIWR
jgi:hypothetical protein